GSGSLRNTGIVFTASISGTVTAATNSFQAVMTSFSAKMAVYSNNSGVLGTQIGGDSATITVSAAGTVTFTWPSNPPILTGGTSYWLVMSDINGT
ncbi:MAG: hypothetical protein J0626_04120, partial [Rhodospirillaceae bacterium]|nr:hypothetical protein [Rhodospirillaceae bacterium]